MANGDKGKEGGGGSRGRLFRNLWEKLNTPPPGGGGRREEEGKRRRRERRRTWSASVRKKKNDDLFYGNKGVQK